MSNLGLKITGTELDVGFNAGTREEFDSYLARLTMIADTIWDQRTAQAEKVGAAVPPSTVEAFERQQRETVAKVKAAIGSQDIVSAARGWREEQGLR